MRNRAIMSNLMGISLVWVNSLTWAWDLVTIEYQNKWIKRGLWWEDKRLVQNCVWQRYTRWERFPFVWTVFAPSVTTGLGNKNEERMVNFLQLSNQSALSALLWQRYSWFVLSKPYRMFLFNHLPVIVLNKRNRKKNKIYCYLYFFFCKIIWQVIIG